jgi:hypothetical protein
VGYQITNAAHEPAESAWTKQYSTGFYLRKSYAEELNQA